MISFLYLMFGVVIIFFEFTRKKDFWFDYLSVFNLYYIIYYIFPSIMITGKIFGYINRHDFLFAESSELITFRTCVIIILAYIFVVIGYLKVPNITFRKVNYLKDLDSTTDRKLTEFYHIKKEKRFFRYSVFFLVVIGFIALIVYSSLFGGVLVVLTNPNSIRDGSLESSSAPLEFIRRFIPSLMYASYIIYGYYLINFKKKFLIISISLAMFWLIVNGGRGALIQYLLVLALAYMLRRKIKPKIIKTLLIIGLLFFIVLYLRPIFMSLEYLPQGLGSFWENFQATISSGRYNVESFQDKIFSFTDSLGYKYVSTEAAISVVNSGTHRMNLFLEIIIALLSVIPSSILPFTVSPSIVYYNTIYILGNYDSPIPPGGVALGYYSFSIFGVIIFSLIVGMLGRKISVFFNKLNSSHSHIFYVVSMFLWLSLFFNGELRHTLQRSFVLIIFFIILIFRSNKFKVVKKR